MSGSRNAAPAGLDHDRHDPATRDSGIHEVLSPNQEVFASNATPRRHSARRRGRIYAGFDAGEFGPEPIPAERITLRSVEDDTC
jgi:hypothetical protein